jgi:signal transduction histidine kinase
MQERAIALGGCCFIDAQPGIGCRITVQLPLTASSFNPLLKSNSEELHNFSHPTVD